MDLTTVMSKVEGDMYSTPNEYAEDIRLIFANSKAYNTNKRSRVSTVTVRFVVCEELFVLFFCFQFLFIVLSSIFVIDQII